MITAPCSIDLTTSFSNLSRASPIVKLDLYSSLRFKGLAQSDKKLLAIIETDNVQKFYKVGDTLDNGFVIQFISLENVTVDISNGTKKYRLTLADIEKLI